MKFLSFFLVISISLQSFSLDVCEFRFKYLETEKISFYDPEIEDNVLNLLWPELPHEKKMEAIEFYRGQEEVAVQILNELEVEKAESIQLIQTWLTRLEEKSDFKTIEHVSLKYIYLTNFLGDIEKYHTEERGNSREVEGLKLQSRLESLLAKSWKTLTGNIPENLGKRLPRWLLMRADEQSFVFHNAIYYSNDPRERTTIPTLIEEFVPRVGMLTPGSALMAMAFAVSGAIGMAGALFSYTTTAVVQNLLHRFIGHPSAEKVKVWRSDYNDYRKTGKTKGFKAWLHKTFFHAGWTHWDVHHGKTYRSSMTEQFESPEQQEKVDNYIRKWAAPDLARRTFMERYGLTVDEIGAFIYYAIVAPFNATILLLTGGAVGMENLSALMFASVMLPGITYPLSQMIVHPYSHLNRDEMFRVAPPWLHPILNSPVFEEIVRNHSTHHDVPGISYGFLPGSDSILGTLRKPGIKQLLRLRAARSVGAIWNEPKYKKTWRESFSEFGVKPIWEVLLGPIAHIRTEHDHSENEEE